MEDPFSALRNSLQSVFHLEAMRNGKYIYPAVQQLKDAMDRYKSQEKNTFIDLLKAIEEALPNIEKWRINFDLIRKSMDNLAKAHQMPSIDWTHIVSHPKVSSRFQFSALNQSLEEESLNTWITNRTGKSFFHMDPSEVTRALVDNKDGNGFYPILSAYLKKYLDFLFHLIMDSEKNFIKICHSRLILYLTDPQIATAIIQHLPAFVHKKGEPFEQVDQVVHTLNDILSKGRSVSTLLRNTEAEPILLNSIFFQLYQSDGYTKQTQQQSEQQLKMKFQNRICDFK